MGINISNQVAYLRTSRNFPRQIDELTLEVSKSYIDIANVVNARIIGIFPTTRQVVTGERWFLNTSQPQQTLRQVYVFGTIAPGGISIQPHGILNITQFSRIWGTAVTNLPDFRPIPYASVAPNANIDLRVDATNIIIANGAGGPTINSAIVVLEWLSEV